MLFYKQWKTIEIAISMTSPNCKKKRSLILLSGGLDSSANLALCSKFDRPVLTLTMNYGQKAAAKEVQSARRISKFYGVPNKVVSLKWLGRLGNNALTNPHRKVPCLNFEDLKSAQKTEKTKQKVWVPNRNAVFIHVAAAYAEVLDIEQVVVGFNLEEAQTFPDNTRAFLSATTKALKWSTQSKRGIKMQSYTVDWGKAKIVAQIKKLQPAFPFEMLWSCYLGMNQPCRKCESCLRLERALRECSIFKT